jgi:hypothetical protein
MRGPDGKLAQMVDDDNNPEIESSPLCGSVTRDGITVRVEIYRIAGRGGGWSLEVIDREGASTVWDDTFADDQDAYDEFYRALELEGTREALVSKQPGPFPIRIARVGDLGPNRNLIARRNLAGHLSGKDRAARCPTLKRCRRVMSSRPPVGPAVNEGPESTGRALGERPDSPGRLSLRTKGAVWLDQPGRQKDPPGVPFLMKRGGPLAGAGTPSTTPAF